jgi:hypothetical protein
VSAAEFGIMEDEILYDTEAEQYIQFKGTDPMGTVCIFHMMCDGFDAVLYMLPQTMIDFYVEGRFQEVPGVGQELREATPEGLGWFED